jgi:hypothetical protein
MAYVKHTSQEPTDTTAASKYAYKFLPIFVFVVIVLVRVINILLRHSVCQITQNIIKEYTKQQETSSFESHFPLFFEL